MQLKRSDLHTERQWRAATGLPEEKFVKLLVGFQQAYEKLFGKTIRQRMADCPSQAGLQTYEELLLFTLFSLKASLSYDLLGFVTGMDGSNAQRNQQLGIQVLGQALAGLKLLPQRGFESVAEFEAHFKKHKHLLFDSSEQRVQRSTDQHTQQQNYSGKKKPIRSKP